MRGDFSATWIRAAVWEAQPGSEQSGNLFMLLEGGDWYCLPVWPAEIHITITWFQGETSYSVCWRLLECTKNKTKKTFKEVNEARAEGFQVVFWCVACVVCACIHRWLKHDWSEMFTLKATNYKQDVFNNRISVHRDSWKTRCCFKLTLLAGQPFTGSKTIQTSHHLEHQVLWWCFSWWRKKAPAFLEASVRPSTLMMIPLLLQ